MQIHPQFRLNGIPLDKDSLYEVAYSWIKEGKDFEIDAGDFLLDWLSPSEYIEVKTSGSTGIPKTLALRKEHMVNSALATGRYFQLEPENRSLLCLSTKYIAGKMMLVRAMVLGMWITVVEPSSSPFQKELGHFDFAAMVPLQVQNSLDELQRIKKLIIGGAPISQALRERIASSRNSIYETYGMTETITHIAVKRLDNEQDCFETLPDVTIRKDDRGCLVINAPRISDGEIITNDLIDIINENCFIWLGRYDNVINSGGVKLIPEQIEEKLSTVIPNRFFVATVPDEKLGERLILIIEGLLENPIKTIAKNTKLAPYEMPKDVYSLKQFEETTNGKLLRRKTLQKLNLLS